MDSTLVEVKFLDWMTHPPEADPVILLHAEELNRIVPVWIGRAEATLYSARELGDEPKRPGMHEVFADAVLLAGQSALRGQITGVHEGVFIASLVLEGDIEIDMRPSDLILVAEQLEVPLYMEREVLEAVSVPARLVATRGGSVSDSEDDASVEEFAEFLDKINADSFAAELDSLRDETSSDDTDDRDDGAADGTPRDGAR